MFSIDQIKTAHAKVKSGADFPGYIQELIQLGVTGYHNHVNDGHTEYCGKDNFIVHSAARYANMHIAAKTDTEKFIHALKIHQQGQTDFLSFCNEAAASGVEKWVVDCIDMSCTYYDSFGNKILREEIPPARPGGK